MHSLDSTRTPELSLIAGIVDQAIRDYTDNIPSDLLEQPRRALRYADRARIAGHFDAVRWVHSVAPEQEWLSFDTAISLIGMDPDEVRKQLQSDPKGVRRRLRECGTVSARKQAA